MTDMLQMFAEAAAFNQDLSAWNVAQIPSKPDLFDIRATAWTNDPAWRPQWGTAGVPRVQSVSSSTANGIYGPGAVVTITVTFDQPVTATGTPQLLLETGITDRSASFDSASGTATLSFSYTAQAGDESADLDYVSASALTLNGGTIQGATGTNATLTLPSPGAAGSLGANRNLVIDTTAPSVEFTGAPAAANLTAFPVTITFSEPVANFAVGDITVTNGAASNLATTDNKAFTADITPDGTTDIQIDVAAAVANDSAGNDNTAAAQVVVIFDTDGSKVAIIGGPASVTTTAVFPITIIFTEPMTDFAIADITVTNGAASNLATSDNETYTADITPDGTGDITIDVAEGVANDAAGNGNISARQVVVIHDNAAPTVEITGPARVVIGTFTITFSESVTGLTESDLVVTGGAVVAGTLGGNGITYTIDIAPDLGSLVQVSLPADTVEDVVGSGNTASNTFEIQAGSTASEFEAKKDDIRRIIREDAARMLESAVAFNQKHIRSARDRLRASQELATGDTSRSATVPFDVQGGIRADGLTVATKGSFYGQTGSADGSTRRIAFGDFDLLHDEDGSTTATFRANLAWERMLSDRTMLGYCISAEIGQSNIDDSFTGKRKGFGLNAGAYVVTDLGQRVTADGFLALGFGRHQIDLTDGILTVDGDYDTASAIAGASLSGQFEFQGFTFSPELSAVWGRMDIGEAAFTGYAYGTSDSGLSLDAGQVTLANLALSSEIRLPLIPGSDTTMLTLTPKLFCQRIDTDEDCNAGGSIGFSHNSPDGLTQVNALIGAERFSGNTQTRLSFNLEHRF